MLDRVGHPPMPIIVGAPRSGTTLLRFMLDAHPDLAIPPETGFLAAARGLAEQPGLGAAGFAEVVTAFPPDAPAWGDFGLDAAAFRERLPQGSAFDVADGFRLFYRMYAERHGKSRWGDKTPTYVKHLTAIESVLPEARFVHLVRDGRDVAVSLRRRWFSPGHAIDIQARFWDDHVRAGREQGRACRHYLELRYEDLLDDPAAHLQEVCAFLELDYRPAMLDYHRRTPERLAEHHARHHVDGHVVVSREERFAQQALTTQPPDLSRVGLWKTQLTAEDAAAFEDIAGDLLRDYGYLARRRGWRSWIHTRTGAGRRGP